MVFDGLDISDKHDNRNYLDNFSVIFSMVEFDIVKHRSCTSVMHCYVGLCLLTETFNPYYLLNFSREITFKIVAIEHLIILLGSAYKSAAL